MINMLIPGLIAFILIFGWVSYEIYNQMASMERRMTSTVDELVTRVCLVEERYKSLKENNDQLVQKEKIWSSELRTLKDDMKKEKIKKAN